MSGATDIWAQTGDDDASEDVFINFFHYQYPCDDPDVNTAVRVSTNGYITFFQQGGNALDGADGGNDFITNSLDPDGYVAPFWDDLEVNCCQGNDDKVSHKTEGSLASRVFTVEWFSVTRVGGDAFDYHFFQVKLFESNNDVELHFGANALWGYDYLADAATIGMEDFRGDGVLDGDCGPNCTATNWGPQNNYTFHINQPNGDSCWFATCLDTITPATGITFGATGNGADTSCGVFDYFDVWFELTPSVGGIFEFDTCGSGFDTTLAVFEACDPSGSGGGQAELACNDDSNVCGAGSVQSRVIANLTAGEDYVIRVSGYGLQRGDFTLTATGLMGAESVSCGCSAPRPYGDVTPFGSITPPCPGYIAELGDGFANMLDVFCAFNAFNGGNPYTECPCADVAPCGGDTFVNMQDVFAIFSAFNDSPACSAPCP